MKKTKLTEKPTKVTSPFDTTIHKTERTANQKFVEWINHIIKERNLPLGIAEQETVGADRKQPDIVIFESLKSEKVLCLIELKPPYFSPFDERELKKPAREKPNTLRLQTFNGSSGLTLKRQTGWSLRKDRLLINSNSQALKILMILKMQDLKILSLRG